MEGVALAAWRGMEVALGESVFPLLAFIRRLKSLPMFIYLGWKVSPSK